MIKIFLTKTLTILFVALTTFGQEPATDFHPLPTAGAAVERRIRSGETHFYNFSAASGEFWQVRVEQRGSDVVLRLRGDRGNTLKQTDSPNGQAGWEVLSFVAEKAGEYKLEVFAFPAEEEASAQSAPSGYVLQIKHARAAAAADLRRIEIERVFGEAVAARSSENDDVFAESIPKFEIALAGWRELKDDYFAELTARQIALLKEAGKKPRYRALKINTKIERRIKPEQPHIYTIELQAGAVLRVDLAEQGGFDCELMLVDPSGEKVVAESDYGRGKERETATLIADKAGIYSVGVVPGTFSFEGRYDLTATVKPSANEADKSRANAGRLMSEAAKSTQKTDGETARERQEKLAAARTKFAATLPLWKSLGEKYWQAKTHVLLADVFNSLDDKQESIKNYSAAAELFQAINNANEEASASNIVGRILLDTGEKPKALEFLERALKLYRQIGDQDGEASVFNNLGMLYATMGEMRQAKENYRRAVEIYKKTENEFQAAVTLNNLGSAAKQTGEKTLALEYYEQALKIFRLYLNELNEGNTLNNIGTVYADLGEGQKALDSYRQALKILETVGDKGKLAAVLHNTGAIYADWSEIQTALEYYERALPLRRAAGDREGEAVTLNNLGAAYGNLGENQKSLEYHNQALIIRRAIGDRGGEANSLNNIGFLYSETGEAKKALELYQQAILLHRAVGNREGEGVTLNNRGLLYKDLGDLAAAGENYNSSLPLFRAVGFREGEAAALDNIGEIYLRSGKPGEALKNYNQALQIYRSIGDKAGEGVSLNSIGLLHAETGERQTALKFYEQSLELSRAAGDKKSEAVALSNIGTTYDDLGENAKAVEFYAKSLPLRRAVGDAAGEAVVNNNLMFLHRELGNPQLAVAYGKQSINLRQQLRFGAQGLDNEQQKQFSRSIEGAYRVLASLLIEQKRLAEAQQVIHAFKDQQFFDFERQSPTVKTLALTEREKTFVAEYNGLSGRVGRIGGELETVKRRAGKEIDRAESVDVQRLENNFKTAWNEFGALLKQAEISFKNQTADRLPATVEQREMQQSLSDLAAQTGQRAVAVYALVGAEKFQALVVTSDDAFTVETKIKGDELNRKATAFWAALRSPSEDPRILGGELYSVIFKQIEARLPAGTTTILWSLDGSLRYVPMPTLHDGKQYLIEKYRHAVFTRADRRQMTAAVSPVWTATGFGSSKQQTVELLGEKTSFSALPAVTDELDAIFKTGDSANGIFAGEVLPDAHFTKAAMLEALRKKRPLVHIASHFAFRPGDDARSFLLMGDGTAFTLAEMKREKLLFDGVELLTLSACNTAAVRPDADGREIDGFAELAQRLGANSVLASLWAVADESTQLLMSEFYRLRKANPKLTKADALQAAQRAMIAGKLKSSGKSAGCRSSDVINFGDAPTVGFKCDTNAPFAHPYFWSPFVLIGNWR